LKNYKNDIPLILLAINHNGAPDKNKEEHDNLKFIEFLIKKGAKLNVPDKVKKNIYIF
jgi:hypothetical protein